MPNRRNTARRAAKRRPRQPRDNRTGVLGKLLIMLAVVAAVVLSVAIFFRVNTVQVQGNQIYSAEQVARVSGVESGDNLVMVNRAAVMTNIKVKLPYVETVSVGLILPDTVVIKIHESEVVGLVQSDTGAGWYLNGEGRILGSSLEGFEGQIIQLSGFTVTAPQAGQDAVPSEGMAESLNAALAVMKALNGSGLMEQVTVIDTQASYDIRLYCGEQYEVQLAGTDELDYKIMYLREVLNQLEPYQTGVIDLTMDQERAAHFYPWVTEEAE